MLNTSLLTNIRHEKPLVHCITNIVVANFQANGLLALGASPIMADAVEEVEEMASISSAVVLNIGTLNSFTVESMLKAGKAANLANIPVVLDPVGAGATHYRKKVVHHLLQEINVSAIRCNAGELASIAGIDWSARGVDAGSGDTDVKNIALQVARNYNTTIAVTGEVDYITDGTTMVEIRNGHPFMPMVTGTGCLLSGITGAFLAVNHSESCLESIATSVTCYGIAGEIAAKHADGPGNFYIQFLNTLHSLTEEDVRSYAKISWNKETVQ